MSTSPAPSASAAARLQKPERLLVIETSALIGIFNLFTDAHNHTPEALESLLKPPPGRSEPMVSRIYIPDQVFYEFSGILPINIPKMVERLVRERDNPAGLKEAIEFYVNVSPRTGEGVKNRDMSRDQIRTLLRFVAAHPECLGYDIASHTFPYATRTAEHYVGRLKAEHAVLGGVGVSVPENYRPTIGNVMDALGPRFNIDGLRIHAGQLFMMGFFTEDEYNQRMELERTSDEKPRFMKVLEFAKHLHEKKHWINEKTRDKLRNRRDQMVRDAVRNEKQEMRGQTLSDTERARRLDEAEKNANYLTVGFLKSFPHLLELYRSEGDQKVLTKQRGSMEAYGHGEALVHASVRPARMLMEHYFYGHILPMEAMADVAKFLDFSLDHGRVMANARNMVPHLDGQGFFERALSLRELKEIHAHLLERARSGKVPYSEASLGALGDMIDALPKAAVKVQGEFDKSCRNPSARLAMTQEVIALPYTGVPYEKVFSEELINGTISFTQFFEIAKRSGSLVKVGRGDPPLMGTPNHDIVVAFDPTDGGNKSTIWIRQSGQNAAGNNAHGGSFVSRSGLTHLRRHYGGAGDRLELGDGLYWRFDAAQLLERTRQNRGYSGEKDMLDRSFAAMLYRGVSQSASQVRAIAEGIIDDKTLIQIEKDFSTRHARRWLKHLPPFTNPMAALHVARRIARKNMGELATAELAVQLAKDNPQAKVTIINHDSDLFPAQPQGVGLSDDIKRMHSGRHDDIVRIENELDQLSASGRVDLMRTDQLLDTLCLLLHHQKPPAVESPRRREPYPGLRIKESMARHTNTDWQHRVHEPLARLRAETPQR